MEKVTVHTSLEITEMFKIGKQPDEYVCEGFHIHIYVHSVKLSNSLYVVGGGGVLLLSCDNHLASESARAFV